MEGSQLDFQSAALHLSTGALSIKYPVKPQSGGTVNTGPRVGVDG